MDADPVKLRFVEVPVRGSSSGFFSFSKEGGGCFIFKVDSLDYYLDLEVNAFVLANWRSRQSIPPLIRLSGRNAVIRCSSISQNMFTRVNINIIYLSSLTFIYL